jgi:UDP-N-acetylglucosamine 2-epimerase (non-hydrolysing)
MRIASVVGARPNFIKLAPVSRALRERFDEVIIHTGQHYDYEMDRIFFDQLGIPSPDVHLGVGSGTHAYQTGEMLRGIEEFLVRDRPEMVLVFGDTTTTLAGALAAVKLQIPVAHVEAGLRSFDRRMPEEINRVLVDHMSTLLFCPTATSVANLRREGVTDGVHLTGDVMADIMVECRGIAGQRSRILADSGFPAHGYTLVTVHRAENTDDPGRLTAIARALLDLDGPVVFPCHPRTRDRLTRLGLWDLLAGRIRAIPPVGYLDMLTLEEHALRIITDSGGVQKEAYLFGVPCITVRDTTEWVETLEDGWNVLVRAEREAILRAARDTRGPGSPAHAREFANPGASRAIVKILSEYRAFRTSGGG